MKEFIPRYLAGMPAPVIGVGKSEEVVTYEMLNRLGEQPKTNNPALRTYESFCESVPMGDLECSAVFHTGD